MIGIVKDVYLVDNKKKDLKILNGISHDVKVPVNEEF